MWQTSCHKELGPVRCYLAISPDLNCSLNLLVKMSDERSSFKEMSEDKMRNSRIFGVAFIVMAFATTSFVFNNCGNAEYSGPAGNAPVVADNESFLNGEEVTVSGNVDSIINLGEEIQASGFVCVPGLSTEPQVRLTYSYFDGTTAQTISSPVLVANTPHTVEVTNCAGNPFAFDFAVPVSTFDVNGALSNGSFSDQVFFVETVIPGATLVSGNDLAVHIPSAIYTPTGLSSGFHSDDGSLNNLFFVWYEDISPFIDGDPLTIGTGNFCTVETFDVVSNVFVTPVDVIQNTTTVQESSCPPWINPALVSPNCHPNCPIEENVAIHYIHNGQTYIGINGKYCANASTDLDPLRDYIELSDAQFEQLLLRERFPGLPCDDGGGLQPNALAHFICDGRTYIQRGNDEYCINDEGFSDPNVVYQVLDNMACGELTALSLFEGPPCNVLTEGIVDNSGGNSGATDSNDGGGDSTEGGEEGNGGSNNGNIATHVIFNGATFIQINGSYCANSAGFNDPNVEYQELSQEAYDLMIANPPFSGPPCDVLVEPPPSSGLDPSEPATRVRFGDTTLIKIGGKYCQNSPDFVDPNFPIEDYEVITQEEYDRLKTERESFQGAPCDELVEPPPA